jgi:Zn-dependent membrane protease YugP
MTGAEAARRILDQNGLRHVAIECIPGQMTDHYDPKAEVIRLSEGVFNNPSVAAVGIAAHEAGHAVQHATDYGALKLRNTIIPVCRFGSMAAMPLFFIGLLFASDILMTVGILAYAAVTLFQLITLPVEFNASRRAMEAIEGWGYLSKEESDGSRRVLRAAAMTYVAALATSLLTLLRLLLIASNGRRRR